MILLIEIIIVLIPVLISIAIITIAERKILGSMQRREGPTTTGLMGLLQPIADGLKLLIKELIIPINTIKILYIISTIISLVMSILLFMIIPLNIGYSVIYNSHNVLIGLIISSIAIYGLLIAGWSGSNKYSILGSIRSSAQMISYELSITLIILTIFIGISYDFNLCIKNQQKYYNILLYWPIAILYFISILAETNRAPFDLPEAESELVSGFNTEYSSLPFAFFFLAEYGFIISQSLLFSILFLGSENIPIFILPLFITSYIPFIKTIFIIYLFILIRGSLPRFRYDLLLDLAWNMILPSVLLFLLLSIIF